MTVCDWYCPVVGAGGPQVAGTLSTYWAGGVAAKPVKAPAHQSLNYLTQAHQSRPGQTLVWRGNGKDFVGFWNVLDGFIVGQLRGKLRYKFIGQIFPNKFSISKSSDTIKYLYLYSWADGSKRSHDPRERLGRYHNLCFGSNLCWRETGIKQMLWPTVFLHVEHWKWLD